jgi:hypothetical protein
MRATKPRGHYQDAPDDSARKRQNDMLESSRLPGDRWLRKCSMTPTVLGPASAQRAISGVGKGGNEDINLVLHPSR